MQTEQWLWSIYPVLYLKLWSPSFIMLATSVFAHSSAFPFNSLGFHWWWSERNYSDQFLVCGVKASQNMLTMTTLTTKNKKKFTSWWCQRKRQSITKVTGIYPLGSINVCTKFHGSRLCSCCDISVLTKEVDWLTDIAIPTAKISFFLDL